MKCDICGSEDTFVRDCKYTFSIQGKEVTIICQKRFCSDCNNEVVDEDLEKETLKKAVRKYNELYGLSKSKILALRRSYHLSQEQFSPRWKTPRRPRIPPGSRLFPFFSTAAAAPRSTISSPFGSAKNAR